MRSWGSWPVDSTRTPGERSLPLAGVRVLDCSRVLAGPFATMLLGDLGGRRRLALLRSPRAGLIGRLGYMPMDGRG